MTETAIEQLDVLVVGAGISGIGMGRYPQTEQPAKQFAILEARGVCGGTWDLFRYPGIRSDSDLHTFGYEFKPWRDKESIAGAPRILAYLRRDRRRVRIGSSYSVSPYGAARRRSSFSATMTRSCTAPAVSPRLQPFPGLGTTRSRGWATTSHRGWLLSWSSS